MSVRSTHGNVASAAEAGVPAWGGHPIELLGRQSVPEMAATGLRVTLRCNIQV